MTEETGKMLICKCGNKTFNEIIISKVNIFDRGDHTESNWLESISCIFKCTKCKMKYNDYELGKLLKGEDVIDR